MPGVRRAMATVARRRVRPASAAALAALLLALAVVIAIVIVGAAAAYAEPRLPPQPTNPVVDEAGLLKPDDLREVLEMIRALEARSSDQIVVYTTRSLQGYPIEEIGYRLGRHWQVGQKDKNNGILLIVAPSERKVRIEVGRGLEPLMTDLLSSLIIQNTILPGFRRGDFSGAIKAGVRDIRDVLLGDAEAVQERARGGHDRSPGTDTADITIFLIMLAFFAFIVWNQYRQAQRLPHNARYRRRNGDVIVLPGGWGGSGGWSGSGGSGGSSGGWSGGGGDFGGGGASGSW